MKDLNDWKKMKATKKIIPALLNDSLVQSTWYIEILTRSDHALLKFSNKNMAATEFRRIKAQGTYGGQWLTEIKLREHKDAE